MDAELAWHVIGVSFRVTRELQDLLSILKEHCTAEKYHDYAQGIARSIHGITTGLIEKDPHVRRIEADLAKFGRVLWWQATATSQSGNAGRRRP